MLERILRTLSAARHSVAHAFHVCQIGSRYVLLVALVTAPLSGCGYMTQSGRQQMAYQHYVRKMSGRKAKLQKKIKAPRMPAMPGPSENKIDTEVSETPQSVTSSEGETGNQ